MGERLAQAALVHAEGVGNEVATPPPAPAGGGPGALEERYALQEDMIGMRAVCLPDVLAKVSMLREIEKGGKWTAEDELLASIAADLEHATSPSPALADALAVAVDRFNISGANRPIASAEAYHRTWREVEAFAPRSIPDVLAKCYAANLH
jgi:hypothetical protein